MNNLIGLHIHIRQPAACDMQEIHRKDGKDVIADDKASTDTTSNDRQKYHRKRQSGHRMNFYEIIIPYIDRMTRRKHGHTTSNEMDRPATQIRIVLGSGRDEYVVDEQYGMHAMVDDETEYLNCLCDTGSVDNNEYIDNNKYNEYNDNKEDGKKDGNIDNDNEYINNDNSNDSISNMISNNSNGNEQASGLFLSEEVGRRFLTQTLANDHRIASYYTDSHGDVVVIFWHVRDAIDFYGQYSSAFTLRFMHLGRCISSLFACGTPWTGNDGRTDVNDRWDEKDECTDGYTGRHTDRHTNGHTDRYTDRDINECTNDTNECMDGIDRAYTPYDTSYTSSDTFHARVAYFSSLASVYSLPYTNRLRCMPRDVLYTLFITNCRLLAVGTHSNVVAQDVIRQMGPAQTAHLIGLLGEDIAYIACTKYGAYTMQTLLSSRAMSAASRRVVLRLLHGNAMHLFLHPIGNYAIQQTIAYDPSFIKGLIAGNLAVILGDTLGVRVYRKCMERLGMDKEWINLKRGCVDDDVVDDLRRLLN